MQAFEFITFEFPIFRIHNSHIYIQLETTVKIKIVIVVLIFDDHHRPSSKSQRPCLCCKLYLICKQGSTLYLYLLHFLINLSYHTWWPSERRPFHHNLLIITVSVSCGYCKTVSFHGGGTVHNWIDCWPLTCFWSGIYSAALICR
jgi:hypothetical protein